MQIATPISIHALREEGDCNISTYSTDYEIFLSTPSARRATGKDGGKGQRTGISIHALREEGDQGYVDAASKAQAISIHALREEGD